MLIGITGMKRSGKDQFAAYLQAHLNRRVRFGKYTLDSYAAPLREFCFKTHGVTAENREQVKVLNGKMTGRQLLQRIGTEVARQVSPDFWVEALRHRITGNSNVIITDVRFNDEAQFIIDQGGFVVKIERGPQPAWWRKLFLHKSERGIDPKLVSLTICNDNSLEDLDRAALNTTYFMDDL